MKNDYTIRPGTLKDQAVMFDIWQSSVRATHHFLKEDDIQKIGIQVKAYLNHATFLVIADVHDNVLGFMGMTENKIDSLFISPQYFGKGLGRLFVQHAFSLYAQLFVDVNEDNGQATRFYEKMGFSVFQRDPLDDEGRPFPILKMSTV